MINVSVPVWIRSAALLPDYYKQRATLKHEIDKTLSKILSITIEK